jgi:hypothetical protein
MFDEKLKGGENMKRRGQAAMEFLMTYGWAILAAIIAIGVLAAFGVFSPNRLVGSSAALNAPLNADAFNIVSDAGVAADGACNGNDCISIDVIQSSGESITVTLASITLTSGAIGTCTDVTGLPGGWSSGTPQTLNFDCGVTDAWNSGDTLSGDISITYTAGGSSLPQQSTGTIRGPSQ